MWCNRKLPFSFSTERMQNCIRETKIFRNFIHKLYVCDCAGLDIYFAIIEPNRIENISNV